ncbi:MAG: response regulator transcription factor [Steroidobacteraceae bacterium]
MTPASKGSLAARNILVADDHPLYRDALRTVIPQACENVVLAEACSSDEVLAQVTSDERFDLIVLDLNLPGASGLSCLRQVRERAPLTPVIVVSGVDDPGTMGEVVMAGAAGYVPKSAPRQVLIDAIRLIMAGGTYLPAAAVIALRDQRDGAGASAAGASGKLTSRQRRVLDLLAQGLSNKSIARTLDLSEITVKAHVSALLRKLGVSNRVQAAIEARKILGRV